MLVGRGAMPHTPQASWEEGRSVLRAVGGCSDVHETLRRESLVPSDEEDVRELFQHAGTLGSVRIVTDQFTGRSRGFGFVEMATREEGVEAIKMLNGRLFRDRHLVVDEARPQPQRSRGGDRAPDRGAEPRG
jgi:hypothetical protein